MQKRPADHVVRPRRLRLLLLALATAALVALPGSAGAAPLGAWTPSRALTVSNDWDITVGGGPRAVVGPDGTTTVFWETAATAGDVNLNAATRAPRAAAFTPPSVIAKINLNFSSRSTYRVAIGPDGTVTVAYVRVGIDGFYGTSLWTVTRPAGAQAFGVPAKLYECWCDLSWGMQWPTTSIALAAGPGGSASIAWNVSLYPDGLSGRNPIGSRLYAAARPAGASAFETPVVLASGAAGAGLQVGMPFGASTAIGSDGTIAVGWAAIESLARDPEISGVARVVIRSPGADGFGSPVDVTSARSDSLLAFPPRLAVGADGSVAALWYACGGLTASAPTDDCTANVATRPATVDAEFGPPAAAAEHVVALPHDDGSPSSGIAVGPDGTATIVTGTYVAARFARDYQVRTRPSGGGDFATELSITPSESDPARNPVVDRPELTQTPDGATAFSWHDGWYEDGDTYYAVTDTLLVATRAATATAFSAIKTLHSATTHTDGSFLEFAPVVVGADGTIATAWKDVDLSPSHPDPPRSLPIRAEVVDGPAELRTTIRGSGSVLSTPAGLSCSSACATDVYSGSRITLTARPATGWFLARWRGPCPRTGACAATIGADTAITAVFARGIDARRVVWSARAATAGDRILASFPAAAGTRYSISARLRLPGGRSVRARGTCRRVAARARTLACTIALTLPGRWRVAVTPSSRGTRGPAATSVVRVRRAAGATSRAG